jgi:hypothetical protein
MIIEKNKKKKKNLYSYPVCSVPILYKAAAVAPTDLYLFFTQLQQ